MQGSDSHVHITTNCWTLPNHIAFMATAVHYEYRGSAMSHVLSVDEVAEVRMFVCSSRTTS